MKARHLMKLNYLSKELAKLISEMEAEVFKQEMEQTAKSYSTAQADWDDVMRGKVKPSDRT